MSKIRIYGHLFNSAKEACKFFGLNVNSFYSKRYLMKTSSEELFKNLLSPETVHIVMVANSINQYSIDLLNNVPTKQKNASLVSYADKINENGGTMNTKYENSGWKWSTKDINYLIKNYGKKPVPEISSHLKRTESAVRQKAFALGLTK